MTTPCSGRRCAGGASRPGSPDAASSRANASVGIAGRGKVERTLSWVLAFRRLTVRYERHAASMLAFLHLACALICLRFLRRAEAF